MVAGRRGLLLVVAVAVGSAAARWAWSLSISIPLVAPDEMLYGLLGRSLYENGHLHVLGQPAGFYSLVYPAVVGLPLALHDTALGYEIAKGLQALMMSLAAVPVYLWGRTIMRDGWALVASALTLSCAALVYSGLLMTEGAFYPLVTVAAWATARMTARPSPQRQALMVTAVAAAIATRFEALALIPAVPAAILFKALFDRDFSQVRRFWLVAAAALAVAGTFVVVGASGLGGYATVAHTGYDPAAAAKYIVYHLAALALLTGVAPMLALGVLLVAVVKAKEPSPEARAFVAVAVAFTVAVVAEVGVFASEYAARVEERDLVGVAPLLFLAFALWLDRGAPKTYMTAAMAAFALTAAVVAVPYRRFVVAGGVQDSPTFAAALHVLRAHPTVDPVLIVAGPALAIAGLFAVTPRKLSTVVAAAVGVVLLLTSFAASKELTATAAPRQAQLVGPNPTWIDDATTAPVGYVFAGGIDFTAVWVNTFWNRSITHVYDTPGAVVDGPMPQTQLLLQGDGVLRARGRPIVEGYIVLPENLVPVGERVATTTLTGSDQATLLLWRLSGTPRIAEETLGVNRYGDISYSGTLREYGCTRGGTFLITFLGKATQQVTLLLNSHHLRTIRLAPDEARTEIIHANAARDGTCILTIEPSSLVGTTQRIFARG